MFSRNFDSQNKKFWLLRERLQLFFEKCNQDFQLYKWQNVKDFIIDGEIVYVDDDGEFLEFQQIDRKHKSFNTSANVLLKQPKVLVFDILGLNGESLCSFPLKYRKKILAQKLNLGASTEPQHEVKPKIMEAGFYRRMKNVTQAEAQEQIKELQDYSSRINCEGLVIKDANSTYDTSGTRSAQWIKLKNQGLFSDSMQDTIDLIPIGAFYGKGARAGIYGAYLMASYNRAEGVFESACKVGTGFSKENLEALFSEYSQQTVNEKPSCYITSTMQRTQPDVWLLPN